MMPKAGQMNNSDGHHEYTILLQPDEDEGGFTVTVPVLPGIVTQGNTLDEAVAMAKDAITLYLEDLIADGQPIPRDSTATRSVSVTLHPATPLPPT
jgi:antitoxin HicB